MVDFEVIIQPGWGKSFREKHGDGVLDDVQTVSPKFSKEALKSAAPHGVHALVESMAAESTVELVDGDGDRPSAESSGAARASQAFSATA